VARTPIVEAPIVKASAVAPVTTAIDPTNGHQVAFGKARKLLLRLNATFAGAKTYTLKAGTVGPRIGQGDLVLSLNNVTRYVQVDADRFMQSDGNLYIDVEAAATGTIEALRLA